MANLHEEWRVIADAPDYAVSSFGRVRRETPGHITAPGRIQKGAPRRDGYWWIMLRLADGSRAARSVHQTVCRAFHGPPPFKGAQVAHLDGTRDNNRADNLRWKTAQGNAEDRERHGRTARGEKSAQAKLTEAQVREIRQSTLSCREAAQRYGVSKATISRVRRRVWWAHISD